MREPLRLIERAAAADCTVLLVGETGTGKELAARAIHALSPRRGEPFLARNCATFSPTLLESELFGHVRGAFTGAIREKKGVFSLADRGTLLLDEIAETPLEIQGRLLRVLQEQAFVPVGGQRSLRVDVRLISATNKTISEEVRAGRFRDDLSFRIRVVPITMPPLRERDGDVVELFWRFVRDQNDASPLRKVRTVSAEALEAAARYEWPGNVRELQNAVEYAFVVGEGDGIGLDDLPPEIRGGRPADRPVPGGRAPTGDERAVIVEALEACSWKREEAADRLGMSRSTLWRKMRELGIVAPGPR